MNAMTASIPADRAYSPLTPEAERAWVALERGAWKMDPDAEIRLFVGFSGKIGGTVVSKRFENRTEAECRRILLEYVSEESRDWIGFLILRAWGDRLL